MRISKLLIIEVLTMVVAVLLVLCLIMLYQVMIRRAEVSVLIDQVRELLKKTSIKGPL